MGRNLQYRRRFRALRLVGAVVLAAVAWGAPLAGAIFTVNSTSDIRDHNPGDGLCEIPPGIAICTLRAAVQEANADSGFDEIVLPAGRYTLSIAGAGEDDAAMGDLDVIANLRIEGEGADVTIVDGDGLDRVFHARAAIALTLTDLTIRGGVVLDSSDHPNGIGGGILAENGSSLQLARVRVADNRALAGGGVGGWNAIQLRLEDCEVTGNEIQEAPGYLSVGGALYRNNPFVATPVIIHDSTIADNGCLTQTAAECVGGLMIGSCTTDPGGAGALSLNNSTVSGNEGAGVSIHRCMAAVRYSTFYGNTGVAFRLSEGGPLNTIFWNSIFANSGIQDCDLISGLWNSHANSNLSSDDSCDFDPVVGDLINTDPELYPLGYFRPRAPDIARSHHPRWGSPVIEAGQWNPSIGDDQEEIARPRNGLGTLDPAVEDMGSIEVWPCIDEVDVLIANETLTSGARAACNRLTTAENVVINGTGVTLQARDSVAIGNGFEVTPGSELQVALSRFAGGPFL